jgi:hypothetical protein
MIPYRKVTFRHANIRDSKDQPMPLDIVFGTIAGWHWSDKSQSTHIYTTSGVFPVLETPAQVDQILTKTSKGDE